MDNIVYLVESDYTGERLDKFVTAKMEDMTRSAVVKLIENGMVLVDSKIVSKNYKLNNGQKVEIFMKEPEQLSIEGQNIPVEIVYEDNSLLVVNKPKGMVVHPAPGNYRDTLVNALIYHCQGRLSSINGVIRPGIVHRIDKNTSGLLLVAKTDVSHNFLAQQIKEHTVTREYLAVITGTFKQSEGVIDLPIGRSKYDRKKMCVTEINSKNAVTHYKTLAAINGFSLVKFKLETGRTHQIRVHCAYLGHPVVGDDVYGKPFSGLTGQCLHAKKIGFIHPDTRDYMEFDSCLPNYFMEVMAKVGLMEGVNMDV